MPEQRRYIVPLDACLVVEAASAAEASDLARAAVDGGYWMDLLGDLPELSSDEPLVEREPGVWEPSDE